MSGLIKLYSYSKCSTCRKAISWLKLNNLNYQLFDIVEEPPSLEILKEALKHQLGIKKLFNTRGISYRKLGASVVDKMTTSDALCALAKDGKLIKRPFLISLSGKILVGFDIQEWQSVLVDVPLE